MIREITMAKKTNIRSGIKKIKPQKPTIQAAGGGENGGEPSGCIPIR